MTLHVLERSELPKPRSEQMRPHPYEAGVDAPGYCTCNLPLRNGLHGAVVIRLVATTRSSARMAGVAQEEILHEEILITGWPS